MTTYSLLSQWGCPACESHKGPGRSRYALQSFCPSNTLVIQGAIEFGGKLKNVDLSHSLKQRLGQSISQDWLGLLFIVDLLHFCYSEKYPPRRNTEGFSCSIHQQGKRRGKKETRLKIAAAECRGVHSCMNTQGSYCMWNAYKWKMASVIKRKQLQDNSLTLPTYPSSVLIQGVARIV